MIEVQLDTDIFSEVLRRKDTSVSTIARSYLAEHSAFTLSMMSAYEVVKGVHKHLRPRIQEVEALLQLHRLIPVDFQIAELAGRIDADLERTGQTIGSIDPIIAATAIVNDLPLVTGNTRHFERVVSLGYPLVLRELATIDLPTIG